MRRVRAAVWAVAVVGLPAAGAADWPQFRGPGGNGVAADRPAPVEWDKSKNVAWAVEIPGVGWGSPVVVGGKVYVVTADSADQKKPTGPFGSTFAGKTVKAELPKADGKGPPAMFGGSKPLATYKWQVLCLSAADGTTEWTTTVAEGQPAQPTYPAAGYACETPACDGDHVYVHFAAVGVFCLDKSGKVVWKTSLGSFPMVMGFGTGCSPVLHGDKLLIQWDNEQQSFLVALDKRTGEQAWKVDRPGKTSWSTPFLWAVNGRTQVVCCGDKTVIAYDADTGREAWKLTGVDGSFTASPTADAERVYFGTGGPGSSGPLYAVRAGATGDISLKKGETANEWVAWSRTKCGLAYASPLVLEGYLYVPGQQGKLTVLDARTGKPAYENERLPKAKSITASPVAVGGRVYLVDDTGRAVAVAAGPEFKVLGEGAIGEMCWATPAAADGALYVRGRDKLYCVRAGK